MSTYRRTKIFAFIMQLLICTTLVGVSQKSDAAELHSVTYASWDMIYSDIDSMSTDAELVIKGKVDTQTTTGEHTIYTVSSILIYDIYKGQNLSNLQVIQVGGVKGEIETPSLNELPLLVKDSEYLLFLKQSNITNQYYIAGAGQGVFLLEDEVSFANLQQVTSYVSNSFDVKLDSIYGANLARYDETSNLGYRWYIEDLYCYIYTEGQPTSTYMSLLRTGATAWNSYNPYVDVQFTNYEYMGTVKVVFDDKDTNLTGLSNVTYNGSEATSATVTFYTDRLGSSTTKWQATACHEFGHVYGLSHYTTGIQPSVMYWDINNCETTPQQVDVNGMQTLYGY